MTIYTPPRIQNARERIGKQYERQIGGPAPMLPDVLAILTSPGMMPLLKDLIEAVEETERSFDNESMNPTPKIISKGYPNGYTEMGPRETGWVAQ